MQRLRILYVADRRDAPFRYRCIHACRQLRESGALANVAQLHDRRLDRTLEAYSIIVLFRLPWSERVEAIVRRAKLAGIVVVFDCDDLIFDAGAGAMMPFRGQYSAAEWEAAYGQQLRALSTTFEACDAFVGSTPTLAEHAARRGKLAFSHPNVTPDEYLKLAWLVAQYRRSLQGPRTIGYFAGSNTHDADFAVVATALRRTLRAHADVRLLLVGHLGNGSDLGDVASQIVRLPYLSFRVLPWVFGSCHVTVAPLARVNEFTDSKSALKFFEPGVFGVPVVATPVAEMRRAITHGVSGWLCSTKQDWMDALDAALDGATAERVGRAAERAVLAEHTATAVAGRLHGFFGQLAGTARGREPAELRLVVHEQPRRTGRAASALFDARDLARVFGALRRRAELVPLPRERRIRRSRPPGVDIVIPVFNALPQTLACIRSALRHAKGDFRLVIIDDASTDPNVRPALRAIAQTHPRVVLLENDQNLGFVRTANRGFAHAGRRDVLLLNSDTLVFRGFLRRLQRVALAGDTTGIACPLSNNATILSVPELGVSNELPAGMTASQMAALVRRASRRRRPEIVTPVGFCMYVRRAVLDCIGPFDAETYGKGFGEENDFGERAKAAGFRVRAADDVYVWHEGKASFGAAGRELERQNAERLEARQPGYHAAVAAFIVDNPLAPIQQDLRFHLRRRSHAPEPAPLFVLHASPFGDRPGGTELVVADIVRALRLPRAVLAYPVPAGIAVSEVCAGDLHTPAHHVFPLRTPVGRFCHTHPEAEATLAEIIQLQRIDRVHIHHLMGWPLGIGRMLQSAGVSYTVTVHDHYCVCPSQNLLDVRTQELCCPASCGDSTRTVGCLTALHQEIGVTPPSDLAEFAREHRRLFAELLSGAANVVFPSHSARSIVGRVHEGALTPGKTRILPHGYAPTPKHPKRKRQPAEPVRIALVGEIAYPAKGAKLYLEVMERTGGAPIEWHLFGPTDRFEFDRRLRALEGRTNIMRHGAYRRDELTKLLEQARVDMGLLLTLAPETFSLTLSELLAADVPVIASRQGALVERLASQPYGRLVDSAAEAAREISALVDAPDELAEFQAAAALWNPPSAELWVRSLKEIDQSCRLPVASALPPLTAKELRRLSETRQTDAGGNGRSTSTTQPASRYARSWWYPWAERAKPWVPESFRRSLRRVLADDGLETLRRFRMPGPRAHVGAGVRVEARYLSTARCTATSDDPHLLVDVRNVEPSSVQAIRFNLWCSHPGSAYAQIYWRHAGDPGFDEKKSIVVPLNASVPDWQEYVVRIAHTGRASEWHAGDELVELRFDPVNFAGVFCLGELVLCRERSKKA